MKGNYSEFLNLQDRLLKASGLTLWELDEALEPLNCSYECIVRFYEHNKRFPNTKENDFLKLLGFDNWLFEQEENKLAN